MFLGLDLGTSELKALLLNDEHQVLGTAHASLLVSHPRPLWSEQAPEIGGLRLNRSCSN